MYSLDNDDWATVDRQFAIERAIAEASRAVEFRAMPRTGNMSEMSMLATMEEMQRSSNTPEAKAARERELDEKMNLEPRYPPMNETEKQILFRNIFTVPPPVDRGTPFAPLLDRYDPEILHLKCRKPLPGCSHFCMDAKVWEMPCTPCRFVIEFDRTCGHKTPIYCGNKKSFTKCKETCNRPLACGHNCREKCHAEDKMPCDTTCGDYFCVPKYPSREPASVQNGTGNALAVSVGTGAELASVGGRGDGNSAGVDIEKQAVTSNSGLGLGRLPALNPSAPSFETKQHLALASTGPGLGRAHVGYGNGSTLPASGFANRPIFSTTNILPPNVPTQQLAASGIRAGPVAGLNRPSVEDGRLPGSVSGYVMSAPRAGLQTLTPGVIQPVYLSTFGKEAVPGVAGSRAQLISGLQPNTSAQVPVSSVPIGQRFNQPNSAYGFAQNEKLFRPTPSLGHGVNQVGRGSPVRHGGGGGYSSGRGHGFGAVQSQDQHQREFGQELNRAQTYGSDKGKPNHGNDYSKPRVSHFAGPYQNGNEFSSNSRTFTQRQSKTGFTNDTEGIDGDNWRAKGSERKAPAVTSQEPAAGPPRTYVKIGITTELDGRQTTSLKSAAKQPALPKNEPELEQFALPTKVTGKAKISNVHGPESSAAAPKQDVIESGQTENSMPEICKRRDSVESNHSTGSHGAENSIHRDRKNSTGSDQAGNVVPASLGRLDSVGSNHSAGSNGSGTAKPYNRQNFPESDQDRNVKTASAEDSTTGSDQSGNGNVNVIPAKVPGILRNQADKESIQTGSGRGHGIMVTRSDQKAGGANGQVQGILSSTPPASGELTPGRGRGRGRKKVVFLLPGDVATSGLPASEVTTTGLPASSEVTTSDSTKQ